MSETDISAEIRAAIRKHYPQIRFTRHHCGLAKGWHGGIVKLGKSGWSDYIGYFPDGRFFALEIKDPKNKTNKDREKLQDERLNDVLSCGGVAIKASSVEEALEKIRRFINDNQGN